MSRLWVLRVLLPVQVDWGSVYIFCSPRATGGGKHVGVMWTWWATEWIRIEVSLRTRAQRIAGMGTRYDGAMSMLRLGFI